MSPRIGVVAIAEGAAALAATPSPFTVAQMPFHGMSSYPYPQRESYPDDADTLGYQLNWNDRFDSGEPVRSYHFDFRMMPSSPVEDVPATNTVAHP